MAGETIATATAYLSLGSNIGDRRQNLDRAIHLLGENLGMGKISPLYDTEPVGVGEQPRFLNLVCRVETDLNAEALLKLAQDIEQSLGRAADTHNLPRPIDIDILFYGNEIIDTPNLVIPHPRLKERAFVLVPLSEIAPELVHPVTGQTIRELLAELQGEQDVKPIDGKE